MMASSLFEAAHSWTKPVSVTIVMFGTPDIAPAVEIVAIADKRPNIKKRLYANIKTWPARVTEAIREVQRLAYGEADDDAEAAEGSDDNTGDSTHGSDRQPPG